MTHHLYRASAVTLTLAPPSNLSISIMQLKRALLFACALLATWLLAMTPAQAQEDEAPQPVRIVIMTVPGGGTKLLAETVATLPNTTPYPESWFNTQVKQRGFSSRTIFKNSKDLRWVMSGANLDLIVDFSRKRRSNTLKVKFYNAKEATVVRTLELEVDAKDGLGQAGADQITASIEDLLADRYAVTPPKPPVEPVEPPKEETPKDDDIKKELHPKYTQPIRREPWLWASGSVKLIKRGLSVSSRNGVVLNYNSVFYPGYELMLDAMPARGVPFGLYLGFIHGFDSVKYQDDNNQEQTRALTQLQFEGGLGYYLKRGAIMARIRGGARWTSYSIDENEVLPSTSQTSLMLQGHIDYTLSMLTLQARLELIPLSFWGEGAEQFGESSSTYGVGAGFGVIIRATPALSVPLQYNFNLLSSSFEGSGSRRFEEAQAYDLTHSLGLGIRYQL